MGLYVSKKLVELHNVRTSPAIRAHLGLISQFKGYIEVESVPGYVRPDFELSRSPAHFFLVGKHLPLRDPCCSLRARPDESDA